MELTLSVRSLHAPPSPLTSAWPPSFPSVPTSRATRMTSEVNVLSWSTIVLTVCTVRRNSPFNGRPSKSTLIRCVKSPRATAPMTLEESALGWTRSVTRVFTDSTQRFHDPVPSSDALCLRLPCLPTTSLMRSSSCVNASFLWITLFRAS